MHSGQWAMEVGGGLADDGLRMESEATASHPTLPVEGAVGVGGSRDSVGGLDIGSSGEDVPPYHSPRQQQVQCMYIYTVYVFLCSSLVLSCVYIQCVHVCVLCVCIGLCVHMCDG